MRQPHSTGGLVHMLPTLAAGPEGGHIALRQQLIISCRKGYSHHLRSGHGWIICPHGVLYQISGHIVRHSDTGIDYTNKLMTTRYSYTQLALMYELNSRESLRKQALFPEEMRYFAMLAGSIVGAELAKRVQETPEAIVKQSESFVSHLTNLATPGDDRVFQSILETWLIETLKDELRFCCANCRQFDTCLDTQHLTLGDLFRRRAEGEDTDELKAEIQSQIEAALKKAPYLQTEIADELCPHFVHTCTPSAISSVISRYASIASTLRETYPIDYRKILAQLVEINLEFAGRIKS